MFAGLHEQYWYGILDHDGIGRRRYREIKEIGQEIARLSDWIVGSEIKNEVALIKSYDNFWSHRGQPHNTGFNYNNLLQSYYDAFHTNHINLDVTSPEVEFSKYKLVLMPAFNLVTEEMGKKCEEYVQNGGALMITFRSGTKTWNNRMTALTCPGYFKDMAGVELEEFDSVNFGRKVKVLGEWGEGTASLWCDVLKSNGAETIATYDSHYYKGTPAVTIHSYGKGRVYYVACDLDAAFMEKLAESIANSLDIVPELKEKMPGVEVVRKEKAGKQYLVVLNHHNAPAEVPVQGAFDDLLTGSKIKGRVQLPGYGVAMLTDSID